MERPDDKIIRQIAEALKAGDVARAVALSTGRAK